jgi:hypothetical protein
LATPHIIKDNAGSNNIVIQTILAHLLSDFKDPDFRRIRYLGNIINLAAKAFLLKKDVNAFKEKS